MRVCLLGHLTQRPTEGSRKVFEILGSTLSEEMEVLCKDIADPHAFREVRDFSPDILHALVGPNSGLSYFMLKGWARLARGSRCVLSALQFTARVWPLFASILEPDAVVVQSARAESYFAGLGWRTIFIPNGVETSRFRPPSHKERMESRHKLGLPLDGEVLLHVGSVKHARNVHWLVRLAGPGRTLLILSRPEDPGEAGLLTSIRRPGVVVQTDYVHSIERHYWASNAYIFPATDPRSAIETPLSVLEAAACNLPILATPFGALPRLFKETEGVFFFSDEMELIRKSSALRFGEIKSSTRDVALKLDWHTIALALAGVYKEVLDT